MSEELTPAQKLKELKKKLKEVESELEFVQADNTKMKGRAEEVMVKMSSEWKNLYKWMKRMHESATKLGYVEAPHGRRRNLYGVMVPQQDILAALLRRAVNAPVQGFGADVGHTAARLYEVHMHRFLRKFKLMDQDSTHVPSAIECAVHDALLQTPPYHLLLPALQIKHWSMTVGVCDWFASYYDHEWLTPPEVETEIGWHEANMFAWDFSMSEDGDKNSGGLRYCIQGALTDQFKAGLFPKNLTVEEVMDKVFNVPEEWTEYLDEKHAWFATPKHIA